VCNYVLIHYRETTDMRPNTRPETCPRFGKPQPAVFPSVGRTLVVGDGDFSFSTAVARQKPQELICSSLETRATVERVYPQASAHLQELARIPGVTCSFETDACKLGKVHFKKQKFDRIVFNFPCVVVDAANDGQMQQFKDNIKLLKKFSKAAVRVLNPGGEVVVTHKTKASYAHWDIAKNLTKKTPLELKFKMAFDRHLFPPYVNRKALDKKSFPAFDAVMYVFGLPVDEVALIEEEVKAEAQQETKEKKKKKKNKTKKRKLAALNEVGDAATVQDTHVWPAMVAVTDELMEASRKQLRAPATKKPKKRRTR
jgi:hypothetical protein